MNSDGRISKTAVAELMRFKQTLVDLARYDRRRAPRD
jgi:hypothetical protein